MCRCEDEEMICVDVKERGCEDGKDDTCRCVDEKM